MENKTLLGKNLSEFESAANTMMKFNTFLSLVVPIKEEKKRTNEEIGKIFDVSESTIRRWKKTYYDLKLPWVLSGGEYAEYYIKTLRKEKTSSNILTFGGYIDKRKREKKECNKSSSLE